MTMNNDREIVAKAVEVQRLTESLNAAMRELFELGARIDLETVSVNSMRGSVPHLRVETYRSIVE